MKHPLAPVKPRSRGRLLLRWALLAVWVAVVAYAAGERAADAETQRQIASIRQSIHVQTLGLREAVARYANLPFAVSRQSDIVAVLTHPEDPLLVEKANRYLKEFNSEAQSLALYVMDERGLTVAASNSADAISFVGQRFSERPYFDQAIKGGLGRFYGVGLKTGEPGLFLAMPVRAANGMVIGVAAVKVGLNAIEAAWSGVRGTHPILLFDSHGIAFLSNVEPWRYRAAGWSDNDFEKVGYVKQYGDRVEFAALPWTRIGSDIAPGTYLVEAMVGGLSRTLLVVDERMRQLDQVLPGVNWTLTVTGDHGVVRQARYLAIFMTLLASSSLLLAFMYWRMRQRRAMERHDANERRLAREQEVRAELERLVAERTVDLQGQTNKLQEERNFRKSMEDSLVVGMRARLLDGRMKYVNDAMCEMVGYGKHELEGHMPPYPYWHQEDLQRHWRDNDVILTGQAPATGFESRIRHRDGHDVYTRIYNARWMDADDRHIGWMSSVVDVTEQKRAEGVGLERQRQHDAQMQHAGRLASLGEMASTLAHELNQPLMALSNFASAAQAFAQQGNQPLLLASLNDVAAQSQRAGEIVRRIRGFVKLRTQVIEDCSINDVVTNVLELLQPEFRRRQAIVTTRLAADLPALPADRILLEQVLFNLVSNALQAMSDTAPERRVVEVETARADGGVCVRVGDRGTGITPAAAAQLFEPFHTTKADGLGLGLNICRTIVESHGGRLAFENRRDGGACFTVFLEVRS